MFGSKSKRSVSDDAKRKEQVNTTRYVFQFIKYGYYIVTGYICCPS